MGKKSKKRSKAQLEKELDQAWSAYVRKRDKVCQKCGGSNVSAHHAFGRRHRSTRWDVINGVGLCYPCHIHWAHRDPSGFSVWFMRHVGEDNFYRLSEVHNRIEKHTTEDLELMLKTIKELDICQT